MNNILNNEFKIEYYLVFPDQRLLRPTYSNPQLINPDETNDIYSHRKINNHTLNEFEATLIYETQEDILSNNDKVTNRIFNNFLNTFLRKLYDCFPKKGKKSAKFQCLGNNWNKNLM